MRVLLVSHHAPPHIGGVENLVLMEAEALREAGHEVVWVTSDGTGAGRAPGEAPGLAIRRVAAWHVLERAFGIAYPLFAPSLAWHLWREVARADLVHVHGLVFPGSPIAALFARLRGRRCVVTDHGGLLRYPSRRASWSLRLLIETVGRLTARLADRLVAYNLDVEALLVRLAGGTAKVHFVANPVDLATFRPADATTRCSARQQLGWDDRPRVLCVSRLLPHKGIDILLAAKDPSFELVFCGPGDAEMQQHIRAHGATCLEPRPREGILQLYQAADVFALPSHNEGFPVVVQEALACGLPVVTSDLPAYAPYRDTPGLRLCAPRPELVREQILAAMRTGRAVSAASAVDGRRQRAAWLQELCGAPTGLEPRATWSTAGMVVIGLFAAHLLLGLGRLPGKVWLRRLDDVERYRHEGAARFLLGSAKLGGAEVIEWLQHNVAEDAVVLWRWPADGALEFVAALLAPRLLVDERAVPPGASHFGERRLARGTLPSGAGGTLVVQGTAEGGLHLTVRED